MIEFYIFNIGWYSNKVAGLFGTMDNEPTTDLMRPDRVIDMNLPSLARSWDVSSSDCKTAENSARKANPADEKLIETCKNLFFSPRYIYIYIKVYFIKIEI